MATADFFSALGLFVVKNFLSADVCRHIGAEMQSAERLPAKLVTGIEDGSIVDEDYRRTKKVKISPRTRLLIEESLAGAKPAVASHFNLLLKGYEAPSFLMYQQGDFFKLHQDVNENTVDEVRRARKISAVIFINAQANLGLVNSKTFSGGSLTFFGLIEDQKWQNYGFPLAAEAGLLVAFRSDLLHEVSPIIDGERQTIVSWYF